VYDIVKRKEAPIETPTEYKFEEKIERLSTG